MIRAGKRTKMAGLSLIELLVTIAVIAILAGVVMAGFSAVQNRTFDAAVQADLASNAKILTEYYSNNGDFPTGAELATLGTKLGFVKSNYDTSNNAVLYCYSTNMQQASLMGKSKTGTTYYVTNTQRTPIKFPASFPTGGAVDCPNSGLPSNALWFWPHTVGGWAAWAL